MTDLLVIGAGPYGLAVAREALRLGLSTTVVGRPMSFWREHMPAGMCLRSGPEWHLDPAEELTLREFLAGDEPDPLPIARFLDYADWFTGESGIAVREEEVVRLEPGFAATLASGETISARAVVAAPGVAHFGVVPEWGAGLGEHTCDLVDFATMDGARVLIVGGRQSAYEWAALLCEHGAERVDVVHRHAVPDFAKVSWAFVDGYIESTLAQRGWWRRLSTERQQAISYEFWRVGRLTLEPWLVPRMAPDVVTPHPGTEVTGVAAGGAEVTLTLSNGTALTADHVVFASGYRADLASVPYLAGVLDRVSVTDGYPDLTEGFETSLAGLYVTGFASTRDFGPFYGFTAGCPSAARIAVEEMTR
ncbi:MAG TPA: FAD-dependent oxidoreductase [Mycobacteriales bacterium]|nr:FAD-dependent oxidoreductase [Mycobacteriales bacterium]